MNRRWLTGLTVAAAAQSITAGLAQASATGLSLLAQGGVTMKQAGARNWVIESLVVVVLVGVALFVICKSSRRV
jgi:hypothetical protein